MQEILEQLWEGEIDHPMYQIKKNETYCELAQCYASALAELESLLPAEARDKVWKAIEAHEELSAYCEKESFMHGVRLGVQMERELKEKNGK